MISSRIKSTVATIALAGMAGLALVSNASAFGFGFGGGGFGGGGFGIGVHGGGAFLSGRGRIPGGFGRRPVECFRGSCGIIVRPIVRRPKIFIVRRPYVAPVPVYTARQTYVAHAPVPTGRSVGCATPASVAAPAVSDQVVFVIFQSNASAVDTASFLKTYSVMVDDGPNQDGYFKLRLQKTLPQDQLTQMVESMKTQSGVVSEVTMN